MKTAKNNGEAGDISEDALLDGRVRLLQPTDGYRVAIDPVLLAACVNPGRGQTVLDVGAGSGAAAFCLASRISDAIVTGIEIQPAMAALARDGIDLNGFGDRVVFLDGDIAAPPAELAATFDHVMTNPPFGGAGQGTRPPHAGKAVAHVEDTADLNTWIGFCLGRVRAKGRVTVIHRADRLDELLAAFAGRAGEITVFPLWPKQGKAAKRVIVSARKGVRGPLRLMAGLVLHEADGGYTDAADAVLRAAGALSLHGPG